MSLYGQQLCPVCERMRTSTPCPTCGDDSAEPASNATSPAAATSLDEPHGETAADDPRYAPRDEEPSAAPVVPPTGPTAAEKAWLAEYLEKIRKEQTPVGRVKKRLADLMLYWPVALCGLGIVLIIAILVASGIRTPQEIRRDNRTIR